MAFTLSVENTLYATEDGLSWLALEDSTDLLTEGSLVSFTDLTSYLRYSSMTLKFNTLDFTLVDPPPGPVPVTAQIVTTDPAWGGNVAAATSSDPVDRPGHTFYSVTATNANTLPNDTAPFDLSDVAADSTFRYLLEDGSGYYLEESGTDFAPGNLRMEGSLAYQYASLSVRTQVNSGGPDQNLGRCVVFQPGLRPGNVFKLTSANQKYSAQAFQINQATITWPVGQPAYVIEFGDTPQTLALWTQVNAPVPVPPAAPPVAAAIPVGPVIYGTARATNNKIWPMGGGIVTIASASFTVSAPTGHTLTCQVLGSVDARMEAWDNYISTPRRGVRATLSGGIFTGSWQELPFGLTRATYDLSSSSGIALPDGTYTVSLQIDTQEFNQMHIYSGWVQVSVTVV